jgi:hypothetical protein
MMAILRFLDGERREVQLHRSNRDHDGHPKPTLMVDCGNITENRGERMFWLDILTYRNSRRVVFDEVPR